MKLRGSFTAEAALVTPVVILTVVSLVMLAMGMRDRVYASAWVREQAALCTGDRGPVREMQLLTSQADISVSGGGRGGYEISCSGSGGRIWPGGRISYTETVRTQDLDQAGFMYRCRIAESLVRQD